MLRNAVRHLPVAGAGCGICKLTGFRLPGVGGAHLATPQIIPSRMWTPSRHSAVCVQWI